MKNDEMTIKEFIYELSKGVVIGYGTSTIVWGFINSVMPGKAGKFTRLSVLAAGYIISYKATEQVMGYYDESIEPFIKEFLDSIKGITDETINDEAIEAII